jgi:hypothetical protein
VNTNPYFAERLGARMPKNPYGELSVEEAEASPNFMKLAGQKKMIRLRQTVYEDPGNPYSMNPFADEDPMLDYPALKMPFPAPIEEAMDTAFQIRREQNFVDIDGTKPAYKAAPPWPGAVPKPTQRLLLAGDPFKDAVRCPGSPKHTSPSAAQAVANALQITPLQRKATQELIDDRIRSMSVSIVEEPGTVAQVPLLSPQMSQLSLSPARSSFSDSTASTASSPRFLQVPGTPGAPPPRRRNVARDSRFYGFYDDILEHY